MRICILLIGMLISSCQEKNCDILKSGTFHLLEENEVVGTIYRTDSVQLEEYDTGYEIAKLNWTQDCSLLMSGPRVKEIVDTITWLVEYEKINDSLFRVQSKAAFVHLDYQYNALMVKTSDVIPEEKLQLLEAYK